MLVEEFDGPLQVVLAIADVRSETQVDGRHAPHPFCRVISTETRPRTPGCGTRGFATFTLTPRARGNFKIRPAIASATASISW
ncbi:hypothetical protein D3C78_1676210 [compost metagenome]